jgi:nitrite reductase/ring-hydroxylating ferredoxin subunit
MPHNLCSIAEFSETSSKGFIIDNKELFIVHQEGVFFAYANKCPHLGINLEFKKDAFLNVEKEFIQCSSHGALFEISSGRCVSGPCLGQALETIDVEVIQERLYIDI